MKKFVFLFVMITIGKLFAQQNDALKHYTFPELETAQKEEARPYVVFLYTDWCRYCHGMKKNTFSDPEVIKIFNEDFYFVAMNAEQKDAIQFLGNTFTYKPSGANTGLHELAEALGKTNGKMTYPTTVFLNAKNEIMLQYVGFGDRDDLLSLMKKVLH